MGDLAWTRNKNKLFVFPQKALRYSAVILGSSGSGKSETIRRAAYGAHKVYQRQVIQIDAKGNTKRDDEESEDSAARFVATMRAAGAQTIKVFPSLHYAGWLGSPAELKNRLLSVIDYSESAYYGDVASNALDLALTAQPTPRSSRHFLANLQFEHLKALHANDRFNYHRVLNLNRKLLKEVEMRYQVFFAAMAGQLDGTLDYADADAVYLRVRGFVLRDEAPRLGRFLVSDFIHYIAERRRAGVQTLLIIDEFNSLRMREETSVLFEQVRDFGGSVIISSQGYAGLGPREYADRILDACSTYILHACSDPLQVSRRAGKRWKLETTYTEDAEGNSRPHHRLRHDWRVPETAVMQQEEGQAFWIYKAQCHASCHEVQSRRKFELDRIKQAIKDSFSLISSKKTGPFQGIVCSKEKKNRQDSSEVYPYYLSSHAQSSLASYFALHDSLRDTGPYYHAAHRAQSDGERGVG